MYHGKPIFFGPYLDPRRELCERLKSTWKGFHFEDSHELAQGILYLLKNPEKLERFGREARQVIDDEKGHLTQNIDYIGRILGMQ